MQIQKSANKKAHLKDIFVYIMKRKSLPQILDKV